MPYSLPDFIAAVLRFFQDNLPGSTVSEIDVTFYAQGQQKTFRLPLVSPYPAIITPPERPEVAAAAEPQPESERPNSRHPMIHRCVKEILTTLRAAGRPLTKTRLLEEMGKHGYEWSESTVTHYLKLLMEDGTITNPPDAKPRGYRLAEE